MAETSHHGSRSRAGQTLSSGFADGGSQQSDHLAQIMEFFNLLVCSSWLTVTLSAGPSSLVLLQGKANGLCAHSPSFLASAAGGVLRTFISDLFFDEKPWGSITQKMEQGKELERANERKEEEAHVLA